MSSQQTDQPDYLSSGTVRPSMSALLEIPTARMMVVRLPLDDTGRKYESPSRLLVCQDEIVTHTGAVSSTDPRSRSQRAGIIED